jgi:single-strand DNA-binding protein
MSNLRNVVHLIGHLGANPEVKVASNGKNVAKFSLATNESYTNAKGEKKDETTWHNLVAWEKTAELAEKYLKKGKEVMIQGKISNRNYEDSNGVKKYISEIIIDEMLFLNSGQKENSNV